MVPGLTWGEAYDAFNNTGIGFTGGICEDVSVGGVSLGGGQSLFVAERGWAVDNIINYEIVLGTGEIVNANQTNNPDLFKALKGGNTDFGIVTRVDLVTFPFDGLWGGEVLIDLNGPQANRSVTLDKIVQATVDYTSCNNIVTDTAVQIETYYQRDNGGQFLLAAVANTKGIENTTNLEGYLNLPNQAKNDVGHVALADFVHSVSAFQTEGYR